MVGMAEEIPDDLYEHQDGDWIAQESTDSEIVPPPPSQLVDGEDIPPPPLAPITIGELIKHYREVSKLSADKLGRLAGLDESGINRIEKGHVKNPWDSTLKAMAVAFAKSIEGQSADRIYEHLISARDRRRMLPSTLPVLQLISDELRAYPMSFQGDASDVLLGVWKGLKKIFKRKLT